MTTFDVTDDASLRAAIFEISNDFADDGVVNGSTGFSPPYTINVRNDIVLTKSLPMIRGDLSHLIVSRANDSRYSPSITSSIRSRTASGFRLCSRRRSTTSRRAALDWREACHALQAGTA